MVTHYMSKLYLGKINLAKINKEKLFKTDKGNIYCDVTIWLNDEPDQYGNDLSIQQSKAGDNDKGVYIGNAKEYKRDNDSSEPEEVQADDLPF